MPYVLTNLVDETHTIVTLSDEDAAAFEALATEVAAPEPYKMLDTDESALFGPWSPARCAEIVREWNNDK